MTNSFPGGCTGCRWRQVCRGGDFENRFSTRNGFDNPSVYCDAYKVMYQNVCDELVRNGYPADLISAKFGNAVTAVFSLAWLLHPLAGGDVSG